MITTFLSSYGNIITISFLIVTTVTGLIHLSIYIRRTRLPKVQVSFTDNTHTTITEIQRRANEIENPVISIFFKNIGKNEIRKVEVCVYVAMSLNPIELRYLEKPAITAINQTKSSHPYGIMRFLLTPDAFSLIKNESGEVQLVFAMPNGGGTHNLKVHIVSANSECGTHDLKLKIK